MKKIKYFVRIWALAQPYHRYLMINVGLVLMWQIVASTQPIFLGKIVTAVTSHNSHLFTISLLMWLGLALARAAIYLTRERNEIQRIDFDLSHHLSRISMKKFFDISMGQHHLGHSVIRRSVISKGEAAVNGVIFSMLYEVIPVILMIGIPTTMLLVKVWQVGLVAVVSMVLYTTFTVLYNTKFVPKLRALDTLANKVGKKNGEIMNNADVVYVNAQEARVRKECDEENQKTSIQGKPMWLSYLNWFYVGQWSVWIFQAACLAVAGWLAFKGAIDTGMFVTVSWWVMNALGSLTNISHIQRNLAKNIGPITKYFKFLDYESDVLMPANPLSLSDMRGRIEFRNVSFNYAPRTGKEVMNDEEDEAQTSTDASSSKINALTGVSFVLEEGKRHAFVGPSGAGKSTIVSLILRAFDPKEGHVLVDGIDIRMVDFRQLRKNIGLVPQDVVLFDASMRYNMTFGLNGSAASVSDQQLEDVSKLSRISEFSNKLEKGWETIIGERGLTLSGGERQRVGIARALIKNPHILIFDEATSSLDTENEAKIRQSIHEASDGKTTLIIAHRLATVKDADKIFVVDKGKIVGEGTHTELLRTNETYQKLVQNQVILA